MSTLGVVAAPTPPILIQPLPLVSEPIPSTNVPPSIETTPLPPSSPTPM